MDFAGMDLADEEDLAVETDEELSEAALDEFRAFLDDIQPEDFS